MQNAECKMQNANADLMLQVLRTGGDLPPANFVVSGRILPIGGAARVLHRDSVMGNDDRSQEIRDRTFRFACRVAELALAIAPRAGVRVIVDQLLRAGTSIGANLEEGKAASSGREFVRYAEISLREAREAVYWLRLCRALQLGDSRELDTLRDEGQQIARIIGAIVVKTKLRIRNS